MQLENLFRKKFEIRGRIDINGRTFFVVKLLGGSRRCSIVTECPKCGKLGRLIISRNKPVSGYKFAIDHLDHKCALPRNLQDYEAFLEAYTTVKSGCFD